MGFFSDVVNGLAKVASNGRDNTMLFLIFQENEGFRRLAIDNFQRCADERGLKVDSDMIRAARQELNLYPKLKMGEFLDAYSASKSKQSTQDIFSNLGVFAGDIIDLASAGDDFEVALKGSALIGTIIGGAKKYLGLEVESNSIFARYLIALQENDLIKMTEMTREMADALSQISDVQHKGALMHYWFVGDK